MKSKVITGIVLTMFLASISTAVFRVIPAKAASSDPPIHIHLTWQNDTSTTITVTWQTEISTSGDTVLYDTVSRAGNASLYTYSATGIHHTYPPTASGYIHDVELTGLTPDTVYYFICGGDAGGWSGERAFRTAPSVPSDVRFVDGGDSQHFMDIRDNISTAMAKFNPSFVLRTGDLVDSGGDQSQWDSFFTDLHDHWIGENNLTIPIMPAFGNHEGNAINRYEQFALPGNERWYSFDYGPEIHITCLDTQVDTSVDQRDWLENDLATHVNYTWKIVFFHKPYFTDRRWEVPVLTYWVPLFDKYHVNIVFNGHNHNYQRTYPLNWTASQTEPQDQSKGTIYVGSGGWGSELDSFQPALWYTVYRNLTYNFCLMDIFKNGTLHFQAKDKQGITFDEFTISRHGPNASFTYSPPNPRTNETVTFDASTSQPGWNKTIKPIINYEWNFGDNNTNTTANPTITHKYAVNKTYMATLNVTDSQGLWNTTSKTVKIYPPHGPTAAFTYSTVDPFVNWTCANLTTTFNASGSLPGWNGIGEAPIVNYTWDFGDGSNTTEADPIAEHVYTTVGNYNVTLTVVDSQGKNDTTSKPITVKIQKNDVIMVSFTMEALPYGAEAVYPLGGVRVNITVTIKNNGTLPANFNVTAYCRNATGDYPIVTQTVTNLSPGTNITLTLTWFPYGVEPCPYNTTAGQYIPYTILAEALLPGDISPGDNILIDDTVVVRFPGDANCDGWVRGDDMGYVGWYWYSVKGYAWQADFNCSGDIRGDDMGTVGWYWYQHTTLVT